MKTFNFNRHCSARTGGALAAFLVCSSAALPLLALGATRAAAQDTPAAANPPEAIVPEADAPNSTDKGLSLGHVPDLDDLMPRTREIERRGLVARDPSGQPVSASDWMNQSVKWMKAEDYARAAEGFRHAAEIYTERGQGENAVVMSTYAARCESRVGLFYERAPHTDSLRQTLMTGRRLEPVYGAYVGAFIDHEMEVGGTFQDEDQSTGRTHHDVAEFDQKIGKKHAAFFTYCGYKSGIPDKWFANLKENGAAAQWAIEPQSLEEIQDDAYLRGMAHAAADTGIPIFVRFASEMNGGWTPYHTPPALYREKFQLVAHVFHEIAPNVAMVWCPNEIPQSNIADYYPGDDAVDWVGVNFYSVYYNNGDPNRPVSWCNPADKLEYVYQHYAARHPIMICEWAATHHEKADGVDRPAFAAEKIAQLYSALPRRYPRVKAVFWLDMNAIEYADDPKTRKNDYSLLSSTPVARAYQRMVSAPYFLDHVGNDAIADREIAPLAERTPLSGQVTLSAYVKTYDETPTVVWSLNGKQVQSISDPGSYDWTLNTTSLPNGPARITATVLDSKGRVAGRQVETVYIENSGAAASADSVHVNNSAKVSVAPSASVSAAPAAPAIAAPADRVSESKAYIVPSHPVPAPPARSLAAALVAAKDDGVTLSLYLTPPDGSFSLSGQSVKGLRVTASVGADHPTGASPTLVMLLLEGSGGPDASVVTLAPVSAADDALADVDAAPGALITIPKSPKHVLRPETVGSYTVRALLLPTRASAKALVQTLSTLEKPTWKSVLAALPTNPLPSGTVVYGVDKRISVVP